jgi:hypothetical protein
LRDGFRDSAFFGGGRTGGARRVDERNDRADQTRGEFHYAARFAKSFGRRLAEVSRLTFFGVAAFLVCNDGNSTISHARKTGDNGAIVAKSAVAVEFDPLRAERADVIERVGAFGMTRELHFVPRR